ncbi:MAG TPA: alpha-ketoglutarate-dependent dioxygenase AlkB [Caulobacteraceae bacterium]|jgi:alkylated DNA repair dioxygenase AlkB
MAEPQSSLFEPQPSLPEGFAYQAEFITRSDERALVAELERLPFRPFEFHGYLGKRRVVYFGHRYDFGGGGLGDAPEIPPFLLPVREKAAAFAGAQAGDLPHVLVTEYQPGAGIGWHRDRPEFGEVIGVSLAAPCLFRLRRKEGRSWRRASLTLEPRSAYRLSGPARAEWEHSIPPGGALRYSLTFRTLKAAAAQPARTSSSTASP